MNDIGNNNSISDYNSNNITNCINNINVQNLNKIKEIDDNLTKKDSIEISEKNSNIINIKKSCDAFRETSLETPRSIIHSDQSTEGFESMFFTMIYEMRQQGISPPSFEPSADNSSEFLSFIDTMKNFMKERSEKYPDDFYTKYNDDFLNFCDSFKEKLTQYGCK